MVPLGELNLCSLYKVGRSRRLVVDDALGAVVGEIDMSFASERNAEDLLSWVQVCLIKLSPPLAVFTCSSLHQALEGDEEDAPSQKKPKKRRGNHAQHKQAKWAWSSRSGYLVSVELRGSRIQHNAHV